MVTRAQLEKDIARLVDVAYQHLPRTADRFFSEIREGEERLSSAVGSLPNICRVQARAMVQAAREIGLSDPEICRMALAVRREERCGVSAAPAPAATAPEEDRPPFGLSSWEEYYNCQSF